MLDTLIPLVAVTYALTGRLRQGLRTRVRSQTGASTLEVVVIALGLLLAAGVAVAAITAAIKSRTDQIK